MGIEIMTKDEILEAIRHHEGKIKSYGVKKLGLFGSFARDEQNPTSDLDLLVEFESEKKTFEYLSLSINIPLFHHSMYEA